MYCPSCGQQIPNNSVFCLHCGNRVDAPKAVAVERQPARQRGVLSPSSISVWRSEFGSFGWGIGSPYGDKSRKLLATLDPPFIPENEPNIFEARLNYGDFRITEFVCVGTSLRKGWLVGTESRLVYDDANRGDVAQIPYKNIKAIYSNNATYTLALIDGTEAIIRVKVPRPSVVGFLAGFGAPPGEQRRILRDMEEKNKDARSFDTTFTRFFAEIADNNRQT